MPIPAAPAARPGRRSSGPPDPAPAARPSRRAGGREQRPATREQGAGAARGVPPGYNMSGRTLLLFRQRLPVHVADSRPAAAPGPAGTVITRYATGPVR